MIQKSKLKELDFLLRLNLGAEFTDAKIIAITGSNGKTTMTSLIYHILKNDNMNVGLGGNIGKSFVLQVAKENYEYYVLEVSSFQLDDIQNFRPLYFIVIEFESRSFRPIQLQL